MARYHFSIVERMIKNYEKFPDKRIFVGVIKESAKAIFSLINSYVIYEGFKRSDKKINLFRKISRKYIEAEVCENLLTILEIEKAHKTSPVNYHKQDRIILLDKGKYKILTFKKLKELINSINEGISKFQS